MQYFLFSNKDLHTFRHQESNVQMVTPSQYYNTINKLHSYLPIRKVFATLQLISYVFLIKYSIIVSYSAHVKNMPRNNSIRIKITSSYSKCIQLKPFIPDTGYTRLPLITDK